MKTDEKPPSQFTTYRRVSDKPVEPDNHIRLALRALRWAGASGTIRPILTSLRSDR
jgi:hypothetical protein